MIKNPKIIKASPLGIPPLSVGEICGANIKPIKVKKNKKITHGYAKYVRDVTVWGVFIHIRMESGDQYDLVFKICRTAPSNWWSLPIHWLSNKNKNPEWNIPWILAIFEVNEWVELIGKRVSIKVTYQGNDDNASIAISCPRPKGEFFPDYYEIIKNKFEPS